MIDPAELRRVEAQIAEIETMPSTIDQIHALCDVFVDAASITLPSDPFSSDYYDAMMDLWRQVSGRPMYDPRQHERTPSINLDKSVSSPSPFHYGDTVFVGDFLIAWGWILRTLKLKSGQRVLEYGVGEGQVAIALARLGCEVSVVDIEPAYLESIHRQAKALGLDIETTLGEFGAVPASGGRFDAILFFESFHHCLRHHDFLRELHSLVTDEGVIAFSGEPITDPEGPWKRAVPYPWGIRLDSLSVRAMKVHGWMELGFQEPYFRELLARTGWCYDKHECALTALGTTYIARKSS